jgi:hypothetical protein
MAALGLTLVFVDVAAADDVTTTISGYGTAGGSFTSNGAYHYVHDTTEFVGAGNDFDTSLDSRIGVQAKVSFDSHWSITAQEVVRERGDSTFDPGTEWLFVQYSPISAVDLRVGRMALATFLLSDSRNVGYAATWFHAPNEVYSSEPFQYIDGAQAKWQFELGPFDIGFKGAYGTSDAELELPTGLTDAKAKNVSSSSLSVQWNDLLVRAALTKGASPFEVPLAPEFIVNYILKDKYLSFGTQYDNGTAIFISEWSKRTENDVPVANKPLFASTQWYMAGGWRFGKLTPMVIYGGLKENNPLANADGYYGTWSVALRYDIVRNIALKAEASRPIAANPAYWVTANPDSNQRINVFGFGADFVF